jgi:hypothetical protein
MYVGGNICQNNHIGENHIYRFNGIVWDTLPAIFDNYTYSLSIYNNELYIGGVFEQVNGINSRGLVKWDGNNFEYFGYRFNDFVTMLKVIDDKLLVGGVFSLVDSIQASGLVWYNGIDFTPLPLNSYNLFQPFDAVKYDSLLIIIGNIDDTLDYNIVCLKDGEWIDFPGGGILGSDAAVADVEICDNKLYVGGYFYKNWGNAGNFIQYFDGIDWKEVNGGTSYFPNSTENAQVHCLKTHNGKLYAGGLFNYAGGVPANKLAVWDGIKWCGLGNVFNEWGRVFSIEFYKDTLFVFGGFTQIDDIQVFGIAKWLGGDFVDTCSVVGINEVIAENENIQIYPNPAFNSLTINATNLMEQTGTKGTEYSIIDKLGREVKNGMINDFPYTVLIENLNEGLYVIILQNDRINEKRKFVKQTQ